MTLVKYVDRRGSNCKKWDGLDEHFTREDLLPLWIADMDFKAPDCVIEALRSYVDFGIFGYSKVPEEWFDAIISWEGERHGYRVKREWICFSPGVVSGFNWLLQAYTNVGDAVIIQTPVYYPFSEAVIHNNRKLVENELVREGDSYVMDLADFEQKIVDNDVKAFIFCSPHNPCGRVWSHDELQAVLSVCKKHGVVVISDEIHQDIIMANNKHIPAATVGDFSDILVTISAPSKTFNVAGCQNSFVIIEDENMRQKYLSHLEELRVHGGNPFGYFAATAAFTGGKEWLTEVNDIIWQNYVFMKDALTTAFPEIWVADLQGTYLMWIDLGAYVSATEIDEFVAEKCKIAPDMGSWFGGKNSGTFIRINLATSRENIETAASNIISALKSLQLM